MRTSNPIRVSVPAHRLASLTLAALLLPSALHAQLGAKTQAAAFVQQAAQNGTAAEVVVRELQTTYQADTESVVQLMADAQFDAEAVVGGLKAIGEPAETVGRIVGERYRMTERVDALLVRAGYDAKSVGVFYRDVRRFDRSEAVDRITELTALDPVEANTEMASVGLKPASPEVRMWSVSGTAPDGNPWAAGTVPDPEYEASVRSGLTLVFEGVGLGEPELDVRTEGGRRPSIGEIESVTPLGRGSARIEVEFRELDGSEFVITNAGGEQRLSFTPVFTRTVTEDRIRNWFRDMRIVGSAGQGTAVETAVAGVSHVTPFPLATQGTIQPLLYPVLLKSVQVSGLEGGETTDGLAFGVTLEIGLQESTIRTLEINVPNQPFEPPLMPRAGDLQSPRLVVPVGFRILAVPGQVSMLPAVIQPSTVDFQFGLVYSGSGETHQDFQGWLNSVGRDVLAAGLLSSMIKAAPAGISLRISEDLSLRDARGLQSVRTTPEGLLIEWVAR